MAHCNHYLPVWTCGERDAYGPKPACGPYSGYECYPVLGLEFGHGRCPECVDASRWLMPVPEGRTGQVANHCNGII